MYAREGIDVYQVAARFFATFLVKHLQEWKIRRTFAAANEQNGVPCAAGAFSYARPALRSLKDWQTRDK